MPRIALVASALSAVLVAGCGENSPQTPAEHSPAVTTPAAGVPAQAAPEATAEPGVDGEGADDGGEHGGSDDWRSVATSADAMSLGRLDQAWRLARAEAEDGGFADQVEALGPLVDPNAAREGRLQPPPGDYRCRTVKLGRRTEGQGLDYVAYPFFRCTVELTPGGDLILTKASGSQRSRGLLYPHTGRQLVFLGTTAWGDETAWPAYGARAERDQIRVLERIGDQRWRLVLPWPKQEAKLELLELVR